MRVGPARGAAVIVVAVVVAALGGSDFLSMHRLEPIEPGEGVTGTALLSDYLPRLAGTPGDTAVYFLEGATPGGAVLVLGGTHGDEPAGHLAAVVLIERVRVEVGSVIVIPRANASGYTHNLPQEGHPQRFTVSTAGGPRVFTYGARASNPVHQWPDPQVYVHAGSGQTLSGIETRNLNRAYPGRPDGTLTERIACAITTLVRREAIDLVIDLHEAAPEYPVVNTLVAHERAAELAAIANLNLQMQGIEIGLEASPLNLRGLSHRELGDATEALAVLLETTNPAQGRLRGRTDAELVVTGQDRYFVRAAQQHRLSVPFPAEGWPIGVRVARHLAGVVELIRTLSEIRAQRPVELSGLPSYDAMVEGGLAGLLK